MDDEYSFYHVNYQPCPQFLTNVLGYTIMVLLSHGAFKSEELWFNNFEYQYLWEFFKIQCDLILIKKPINGG